MSSVKEHVYIHITPPEETLKDIQKKVTCPFISCKKIFLSNSVLKLHITQSHEHTRLKANPKSDENIIELFHCPVEMCHYNEKKFGHQKYFKKFKYLKQHFLKVHASCNFLCNQCDKKYSTQSHLNAHLMYCDLNLVCTQCGNDYSSIESMLTHIRRTGHHADAVDLYYQRIRKKKQMKTSNATILYQADHDKLSYGPRPISQTSPSSLISSTQILPKPQSSHIIAALALSELAFAGLQRLPSVDVGVQTEFVPSKRVSRKFSMSPSRSKEHITKKKQTTETETQTRLTNLKNKRKRLNSKHIAKCSIATDTNLSVTYKKSVSRGRHTLPPKNVNILTGDDISSNVSYLRHCPANKTHTFNNMLLSKNFDDSYSISGNLNTSATQTSPRVSLSTNIISQSAIDNITYNMFDICHNGEIEYVLRDEISDKHNSSVSELTKNNYDNEHFLPKAIDLKNSNKEMKSEDSLEMSNENLCQDCDYGASQVLIEDDNYESLSTTDQLTSSDTRLRRLASFSQIRSSSIETQTEHDVFLSTHVQTPDDADDIILASTETQTDHGSSSLWCTSETQTCEDFSDIEQYLCSTIHTQTHDEHDSDELFPELNFTTDTHTQTALEESPALITACTQTCVPGLYA